MAHQRNEPRKLPGEATMLHEREVELSDISQSDRQQDEQIHELYVKVAKIERGKHEKMRLRSHIKEIIKNEKATDAPEGFIPCLFMPYLMGSSKLLIYFHGNAEDIGLSMELLIFVRDMLKVSELMADCLRCTCWRWSIQVTAFMRVTLKPIRSQLTPRTSMTISHKPKESSKTRSFCLAVPSALALQLWSPRNEIPALCC